MIRRPPRSTRTDTLFPYTTLFRSISRRHRLAPDGLSLTLRAGSGADHGSFTAVVPIHPKGTRVITAREAARLHSIPDWVQLSKTKIWAYRQIGNSVQIGRAHV